jgi:lycopene cyclase domain-containing protein
MSTYLLVDLLILIIPLALSFEKRIQYYKKFPALLFAIFFIGPLFLFWDFVATKRGDWAFNQQHLIGLQWEGLPLEEFLFFVVVPFSCLFTYEVIAYFIKERELPALRFIGPFLFLLFLSVGTMASDRPYTRTVNFISAFVVLIVNLSRPSLFVSRIYWMFIFITLGAFVAVNSILTALPVVIYNDQAFSGYRLITIPLEDFSYNFAILTLWLVAYLFAQSKRCPCV